MTLQEQLKEAQKKAEHLQRCLELETALELTDALQEAADAESALIIAKAAFEGAREVYCDHGKKHDYLTPVNGKDAFYTAIVNLKVIWALEPAIEAEYKMFRGVTEKFAQQVSRAAKRLSDAIDAVEAPLQAANASMARLRTSLMNSRAYYPN
jgi:hypothetical protein